MFVVEDGVSRFKSFIAFEYVDDLTRVKHNNLIEYKIRRNLKFIYFYFHNI